MGEELKCSIGDISHIENIANYVGAFPRITFDEATVRLKEMFGENIHKYVEYNDGFRNFTRQASRPLY